MAGIFAICLVYTLAHHNAGGGGGEGGDVLFYQGLEFVEGEVADEYECEVAGIGKHLLDDGVGAVAICAVDDGAGDKLLRGSLVQHALYQLL